MTDYNSDIKSPFKWTLLSYKGRGSVSGKQQRTSRTAMRPERRGVGMPGPLPPAAACAGLGQGHPGARAWWPTWGVPSPPSLEGARGDPGTAGLMGPLSPRHNPGTRKIRPPLGLVHGENFSPAGHSRKAGASARRCPGPFGSSVVVHLTIWTSFLEEARLSSRPFTGGFLCCSFEERALGPCRFVADLKRLPAGGGLALQLPGIARESSGGRSCSFLSVLPPKLCPVRTHSKHMPIFVKKAFACIQHSAVQSRRVATRRQDSTTTKKINKSKLLSTIFRSKHPA